MQSLPLLGPLSRLSLRGWVFVLGVFIALLPWQPGWMHAIDRGLFTATSYLVDAPKGASRIGLVEVPPEIFGHWQADLYEGGKLAALLSNVLHSSDATVGILLEAPLDNGSTQIDSALERLASGNNKAAVREAAEIIERKRLLLDLLGNSRVVIGVEQGSAVLPRTVTEIDGVLAKLPEGATGWLWPMRLAPAAELGSAPLPQRGVFVGRGALHPAIAREQGTQSLQVSFLADFLAATTVGAHARTQWDLAWQRDRGLLLGERLLPLSPRGDFLAFNATSARMRPLINRMSLEEGLARGAFPNYVLIAVAGDPVAPQVAAALYSALHGHVAATPWWQSFTAPIITLVITLLLVFALPRVSAFSGAMTCAVFGLLLLLSQTILVITKGWWLPIAEQLVWIALGLCLIRLWVNYHGRWQLLIQRADEACIERADGLIEVGDLQQARTLLDECSASPAVLQKYYDLGNAHVARRQYRTAIDVYQTLANRKKNFRDTEQKIGALEAMVATSNNAGVGQSDVETTMVLSRAHIDRPVLGRYEIHEELGRGAMGIVYLGFDPRIARYVAIKTLNYGQFQPRELDNIKTRFFREAEAAGRLTHPNIVSVYDVGEERDLAFIAMDYVEGKALNAFIDPNCLLPVFEVYRIIADVATALEYAHASNIVHRDIKPGNIIYNPSPYQVKVTDFGIARLMDDSKTSTGEILGSPLYMSPEQLKGRKVDPTADVFSLGVTFYQLLCGYLPFSGDNLASLTYEIIHGKHRSVRTLRRDLPSSAARITNQCLQKESQDRYESAGELALVLKKAIRRDFASEARKAGYL
ncbi:serine/threonine-protein kinase [Teredinibacter turnerae]|uniref:serine/threonine-protein kinase n=1 Tax=Teredinibacter turnerae TaxID=2426 RepID=UPI000367FF3D|nr:protein kinase [Teredinibacter turnerae]